jgi:predicted N-acyltransferase
VRPGAPRETLRVLLIQGLKRLAVQRYRRPGLNLMHIDAELAGQLGEDGWLISHEQHAFWYNRGYADFEDWLGALPHRKRYTIRRERRRFAELGLDIRLFAGPDISPRLLEAYYAGHRQVCLRYGNRPWLPPETLRCLVEEMPGAVRLLAAFDRGRYIAGAFWIVAGEGLVLRTWSAFDERPGLCFELNCHRPIEFALENGLKYVDAGLTAAYKPQRGYFDEAVASAHWFSDPRLRRLAERELAALAAPPA